MVILAAVGAFTVNFTRPIALLFVAAAILAYITPMVSWYLRLRRAKVVPA